MNGRKFDGTLVRVGMPPTDGKRRWLSWPSAADGYPLALNRAGLPTRAWRSAADNLLT